MNIFLSKIEVFSQRSRAYVTDRFSRADRALLLVLQNSPGCNFNGLSKRVMLVIRVHLGQTWISLPEL